MREDSNPSFSSSLKCSCDNLTSRFNLSWVNKSTCSRFESNLSECNTRSTRCVSL